MIDRRAGSALPLVRRGAFTVLVIACCLAIVFPVYWMLNVALQPPGTSRVPSPPLLPPQVTFDNFVTIFVERPMGTWLFNSTIVAVVCVAVLAAVLKLSPMGRRIRAVVQNRDLAETSGISSRRTDITTFFIGSGLASVAGVALTLIGSTSSTIGQSYLIDAFLVVVIGGLGQIKGTVIAAFALGLMNSFIEYSTTASLAKVIVFVVIVIFLQARPQGLFTVRTRSLV